jgi:hypothetical protein
MSNHMGGVSMILLPVTRFTRCRYLNQELTYLSPAVFRLALPLRPSLLAENVGYPNRVAYVLKCTVRRPVVFYLCRQRVIAELCTCIPSLLPHSNFYSRNIAYLVSSREQETVIAADRNRQSSSNGGGDRDGNGDSDSGKEDNEANGGNGDSNGNCDSGGGKDKDNGGNSASGGHKQQSTK